MMTVDYQPDTAADCSVVPGPPCLDITVAIPTYNGADRVPQVLDRLLLQEAIDGLRWEVIVCDNNSCDRTAEVVAAYQQTWPKTSVLRYCFVAEQGAAFARQRAIVEAAGTIVAFLDDDNIPAGDWLSHVYRFAQDYPQAGAFGSQIHGDFQGTLPDGFEHIACFLAIVERGNVPHLYRPKSKILPPAAGLAVRRSAWLDAVPERLFLNHKGKSAGLASEDLEALLHIQKAGWEIWYNSDMVITHQIPSNRLQQEYLVALLRCVGLSRFYIRLLGTKDWQRLFKAPAYIANDIRKLALHYLKNGPRQASLNTVAACERALLTSIVVSPVFLLRKASQDFWQNRWDNAQLPERQQWLSRLTDAFESQQLELYQQEIAFLGIPTTLEQAKPDRQQFEILLRLRQDSPDQPPASPARFLPTAERYGLMRTLDRRVIQQVFTTLGAGSLEGVYSLNLSLTSVCDRSFPTFLEEQLQRHPVCPDQVCFEISEATTITAESDARRLIAQIKQLGLRVAIDEITGVAADHGTQLPVDCLKLSKDLVVGADPTDASTALSSWVQLSQRQGIQLVVKGIETQALLDQVQGLGIQYVQGYQLSKPSPFTQTTPV
ncbi:MAG: hormogonium polysaccharide biosynthesis glycosyltransferase HpsE [Cyanobacteria bacterium P01_A01_bin.15]